MSSNSNNRFSYHQLSRYQLSTCLNFDFLNQLSIPNLAASMYNYAPDLILAQELSDALLASHAAFLLFNKYND